MYHPQGRNANNTNDQDVHTSQQMQLMNHPENLAFFAQQPQQQMSVVNTAGFNDFSQLMDPMFIAAAFSSRYTNNNFSQDPLMGGNNGNFMMPPQSELTTPQYPFDLSSALPIANTPAPSTSTNNHQNQQPQTAQKGYKATPRRITLNAQQQLTTIHSRKRTGKDEKVLVELHHREILGIGFILSHCYVMGQSRLAKDWLTKKRLEVQDWLVDHFGPSKALRLVDPCRPYYTPTTPAELIDSEIGMALS